jgi:hypothetical protein
MPQQRKLDVVLDSVARLLHVAATANLFNSFQRQRPADLSVLACGAVFLRYVGRGRIE